MIKKILKDCIIIILIFTLLPVHVYAESGLVENSDKETTAYMDLEKENNVELTDLEENKIAEESTTEGATTEGATTEGATTEGATTEGATTEESATEESATEEPATEDSATEESATEESTIENPVIEETTTEDLDTEETATEESKTEAKETAELPEENTVNMIDTALSERADSDGDEDLPAFLQEGISACGISGDQSLSPSSAKVSDVVEVITPIILTNEVGSSWSTKYGTVTRNDNGYGISVGILQWNSSNALVLLKSIISSNPTNAQSVLGTILYQFIQNSTSWAGSSDTTRFIPDDTQANAIAKLLASSQGKSAQDTSVSEYIYSYVNLGYNTYHITNVAALCYLCDLKNQCGLTTVANIVAAAVTLAGGNASDVTLNEMHEAALLNSVAGKYLYRRYNTYGSIADAATEKGWNYYNTGSYRIPIPGTNLSSLEIKWLQWALNASEQAGLTVDGQYGTLTQEAVKTFQATYSSSYSLTVDGYAGQQTITALIKVLDASHLLTYSSEDLSSIKPTLGTISSTTSGVNITWSSVSYADGYYVYRKASGESWNSIKKITSASTQSYTDITAVAGTTYSYTVSAYNQISSSSYNASGMAITYLKTPDLSIVKTTTTGVKVSWVKVDGASGYYVYRKASGGSWGKIKKITSGSTVSYTDKTVVTGTTYSYTVRAYNTTGKSFYNAVGIFITYLTTPKLKSAALTTSGIKISWSKVSGVSGYYIYRKKSGESWSIIKKITSSSTVSYTDKTGKTGKTYSYMVKSYKGGTVSSYYSGVSQLFATGAKYKTTTNLYYRNGSGTSYSQKGIFSKSKVVYVVKGYSKKANGYTWYKVVVNHHFYYVAAKYLVKV